MNLENIMLSKIGGGLVAQSCLTLVTPWTIVVSQALLSMGFSRQEYWGGLPFPSPSKINQSQKTTAMRYLV